MFTFLPIVMPDLIGHLSGQRMRPVQRIKIGRYHRNRLIGLTIPHALIGGIEILRRIWQRKERSSNVHQVGAGYYTTATLAGKRWTTVNLGAVTPWTYTETQYPWKGTNDSDWDMLQSGEVMPEKADFEGLKNNCTHTWISIAGVKGHVVFDNAVTPTGGYMFLPAAGYTPEGYNSGNSAGTDGFYWSRAENDEDDHLAWTINFHGSYFSVNDYYEYDKFSVRPLKKS